MDTTYRKRSLEGSSLEKYVGKVFVILNNGKLIRFVCRLEKGDLILREEMVYILGYSHPEQHHEVKLCGSLLVNCQNVIVSIVRCL